MAWVTALALAALAAASAVLTPQNFEHSIEHGLWFVEHFSPYCGHCRDFEPTWNDLVDHYEAARDTGVHLAQVNCALNGDLCNDHGVNGYPQMNLYRDGEFVGTYSGSREFHLLLEYLNSYVDTPQTEQDTPTSTPTPTPTPSPSPAPERLVVQSPRTDANPSGTVVPLNVQTFDNFLTQGPAFIKFFAPWCGHCKKLAPAWTQLGRRMQHKLNVAEVDCELHKLLCTSQGVTGFPMLFYYAHGAKTEYTGPRAYDQLVSFADKASNPTMQVIDAPELDQVVHDNDVLYLLLHDASDDQIVTEVAKSSQILLGSPPVYVSASPDLWRKYDLPSNAVSALLAFKDGDAREPVAVYYPSSGENTDALRTWLHTNRFPSSLELSKEVLQQVMNAPHRPLVVIVATPVGQQGMVSDALRAVSKKWRLRRGGGSGNGVREVVFTWMDAGQWEKWLKDMYGVKVGHEPVVVVADHERLVYYDRDASDRAIQLNSVSVASALDTILEGTARPKHSRSALERGAQALNAGMIRLERSVVAHPYRTVLVVLGLAGVVAVALRSLFADEGGLDLEAEKRYAKRGRLD